MELLLVRGELGEGGRDGKDDQCLAHFHTAIKRRQCHSERVFREPHLGECTCKAKAVDQAKAKGKPRT